MQEWLSNFKQYALINTKKEACGVVIHEADKLVFVPCENISKDPQNFTISPVDYALASKRGSIKYICHSHLGTSAKPSEADIYSCNFGIVPWVIFAVESGDIEELLPTSEKLPLLGRAYAFGSTDCLSLVLDTIKYELDIDISRKRVTSDEDWFKKGSSLIVDNIQEYGFIPVSFSTVKKYDLILFKAGNSPVPNHLGIKHDDNYFYHHLYNRISCRDSFNGYWQKCAVGLYRYKDLL